MLWNDEVLFIHTPKTAGMSITTYLESNLLGDIFISVPKGHEGSGGRATYVEGTRHERLHEAGELLKKHGRNLNDFKLIVSGMRNPYDMEISRYHHVLTHYSQLDDPNSRAALKGLEVFVAESNFYGSIPPKIEEYYTLDGMIPENLRFIKYETLTQDVVKVFADYISSSKVPFPHENATEHQAWQSYMTPSIEAAIYERFYWLFQQNIYQRYEAM